MNRTSSDGPSPNLEQEILDLTGGTEAIENSHINESTRDDYIGKLIMFMVWLFDNKPNKLVHLGVLQTANQRDIIEHERLANTCRQQKQKKRKKEPKKSRKSLRAACRDMLECMDRRKKIAPFI